MSDAGNPWVAGANVMRLLAVQRSLALTAYAAARAISCFNSKLMLKRLLPQRTLSSRTSARRRSAWTTLLLRWARKPVAVWSSGTVRASALPARPTSQFHWHFHLAALLSSDRERHEARPTVISGPFQPRVGASRMNPPDAHLMPSMCYRRLRGPMGTIERAGEIRAYPPSKSIGQVRFAALAENAGADAWKASPALGTERTSYMRRWLRGEVDSRLAELPHAPAAQSFLTRRHLQPGAQSFDRTRVAGRNASGDPLLTPTSMTPRSPRKAPAAMTSTRRVGTETFLPQTRSPVTRTFLRSTYEHPAAYAFDSSRPLAVGRQPSEQTWRTRDPAATATHSSRHIAAPRTASSIAMRRPVDLVWRASPISSLPSDDTPRFGTTSAAGASSARSTQAVAQVPMTLSCTSDNTVVRATALDPVLADRLADDVIRRIDHRARIERERRGL